MDFWLGFEKNAMTNKGLLKKYYLGMLDLLRKSKDPTDKAIYKLYISRPFESLGGVLNKKIRDMGESPAIPWRHDAHPEVVRNLIHETNINKSKPGWVRSKLIKDFGEAL